MERYKTEKIPMDLEKLQGKEYDSMGN